jgi:hypothetical protein
VIAISVFILYYYYMVCLIHRVVQLCDLVSALTVESRLPLDKAILRGSVSCHRHTSMEIASPLPGNNLLRFPFVTQHSRNQSRVISGLIQESGVGIGFLMLWFYDSRYQATNKLPFLSNQKMITVVNTYHLGLELS